MSVFSGMIRLGIEVLTTIGLFFAFAFGYVFLLVILPSWLSNDKPNSKR